jgi:hypothetical protein
MNLRTRREFLRAIGASVAAWPWLENFRALSAPLRRKVKITGIKVMVLQGPRSYTLG